MAAWAQRVLDPTVLLVSAVVLQPPVLEGICHAASFRTSAMNIFADSAACLPHVSGDERLSRVMSYFADPWFLMTMVGMLITVAITRSAVLAPKAYDRAPLLPSEHRASTWYLLNGWFVHMFLGGLVGCFHKLCLMDRTHGLTDRRYTYDFHDDRGSIVRFVGMFDLFVLGPLCVILFVVYQVQGPIRDVLEVSVCTMQLYGNLIVVGGEMVDGFVHVWRGWTLTLDSVLYFWLLFALVKSIWFLVPLLHGIPAFARVVSACSQSHEFRTIKVD